MKEAKMVPCQQIILEYKKTQQVEFSMCRRVESSSIKILGLHVDNKLTWSSHINSEEVVMLSSVLTYFANFHSIAMYGLQFLGMAAKADRIFKLEKKPLRILCNLVIRQSSKQAFIQEKMLTLLYMYRLTIVKRSSR